jgi:hypothetical protein
MNHDRGTVSSAPRPDATPDDSGDNGRHTAQRHPMISPSDAEKYRWLRANRGNFAIVDALNRSDRDGDFDARIEAEMQMCAAGTDSYMSGRKPAR